VNERLFEIKRLLGTTRLLTLTGSGGAGKIRLALEAAAGALDAFPNGVWVTELASVTDATMVSRAVEQGRSRLLAGSQALRPASCPKEPGGHQAVSILLGL
jgi:hypothetical protein